jgi:DNA gyrase/topoisomerase IV subunit B
MLVIFKNKEPYKWFFNFTDYNNYMDKNKLNSDEEITYYKGLGTWIQKDLEVIFKKDKLENFIETFEYDEDTDNIISSWMDKTMSDLRKDYLKGISFDIERL